MSRRVCVCALLLLATVCRASNIVKGLYCRDPDTGKLYAVNSTWPSQTFCGNYTCKLRKRNTTETQYAPLHKIDITKFQITDTGTRENDMAISPSVNAITITKKTDNDKQPIFHKDLLETDVNEPVISNKDLKDNDGYLTESEIKTISDMLHTVKKSDLEAIVDIYNLAQDIYKEIDAASTDKPVSESKNAAKFDRKDKIKEYKHSYWYEPVQFHNKHVIDMSHEETNVITTKKPPSDSNPTFFKGPLSERDFGKLPYYYPMSNFQRLSSYVHNQPNFNDLEKQPSEAKACSKAKSNYNYVAMPWYITPSKKLESSATVRPSTLLPYPFSYIYHYNGSGYQPNYYYNYPWTHADYNRPRNYPQPYYGAYITQHPNYGLYNKPNIPVRETSLESNISEEQLLDRLQSSQEKKTLPDWQTGPLPENVLDEVRAHIEIPKSLKPIPLKNNIKFERVGKVIKMDEITRQRREVKAVGAEVNARETYDVELEAYIDKTICENNTEPGYFSIGNLSQPYPACCPQKLYSIHTAREVIKIN